MMRLRTIHGGAAGQGLRRSGVLAALALGALLCSLGAAVAAEAGPAAASEQEQTWRFVARFHAVFLHLPIGFLVLAFLLEIASLFRRNPEREKVKSLILLLNVAAAGVVVAMGLLLAREGGFEPTTLTWHKWLGIGFTALSLVTAATHWAARRSPGDAALRWWYRGVLTATVVVMMATGHYGGNLTHGSQYLVEHVPQSLRELASLGGVAAAGPGPTEALAESVYAATIQPIFRAKCYACHGSEKQKGDYRLDVPESALGSGESGKPAIVPGEPLRSHLLELVLLPPGHEDAMPPRGKEPLRAEEILSLARWIQGGASFDVEARGEATVTAAPGTEPPATAVATAEPVPAAAALAGTPASPEPAIEPQSGGAVDFSRDVKPVLEKRCVSCHGPKKRKGRLGLHTWDLLLKGGKELGAAVVPGDASKSPLFARIAGSSAGASGDELMPPADEGGPLAAREIELIRHWIDQGARWPQGLELKTQEEGA
jgi:uncharacterized membrane protein